MVAQQGLQIAKLIDPIIDETGWLDQAAVLVRAGRIAEVNPIVLSEYLCDMARRDRREVYSRLIVLLTHLLKWDAQPERRGASWRGTIREQRRELRLLLESATLKDYAETVLSEAYSEARLQAADETELNISLFPLSFEGTLDDAMLDA
jgi:hypothetical protein